MTKMPERKYCRTFPRASRLVRISFFSLILWVAVLTFPYAVYRMITDIDSKTQQMHALMALAALIAGVLAKVLIYLQSARTRCPLCQGNIFHRAHCRMHDNARKHAMMTYATSTVMDILLHQRFICKYCGTPFRLRK